MSVVAPALNKVILPSTASSLVFGSLRHKQRRKYHSSSSSDIVSWATRNTGRDLERLNLDSLYPPATSQLFYRKEREKKATQAGVSFNSVSRIDSLAR